MSLHELPVDDLIEHEPADACVCGPRPKLVERDGLMRWVVVHASLDGREQHEAR